MCGSMVDIQYPTAEIRWGKKKKKERRKIETTGVKYNGLFITLLWAAIYSGETVCINMKRVCGFAVSRIRYVLLRRIAVLCTYMRPIVTDRITWSVGLFVGQSVSHASEPCRNGWSDRVVGWVEDSGGPDSAMGRGNFERETGEPL